MQEFGNLKKINDDYKSAVDSLSEDYDLDGRRDYQFSDEIKAQRLQERNARFNAEIDKAAREAADKAAPEFVKLREKLRTYITTGADPVTLSTIQVLIAGGVELTDAEIAAFADGAGYAVLRLLEGPSKGHVQAPKLDKLEAELKELEAHFRNLRAYRGGMAGASTETFWGMSATVGSVIQQGMIDKFHEKVDEIANGWELVLKKGGDA